MDKKGFGDYMSQLNFATHCASTACGISSEHLLAEDVMIRSIYCFHVVFQTRKILNTLGVRLPYINEFDLFKSRYNLESYRKLCDDFDVHPSTDWQYKYDERQVHSRWENRALCDGKFCDGMDSRP